jgi:hypothetical protein
MSWSALVLRVEEGEIERHSIILCCNSQGLATVEYVRHCFSRFIPHALKIMGPLHMSRIGAKADQLFMCVARNLKFRDSQTSIRKKNEAPTMVMLVSHPGGTSIRTEGPSGVEFEGRFMMG